MSDCICFTRSPRTPGHCPVCDSRRSPRPTFETTAACDRCAELEGRVRELEHFKRTVMAVCDNLRGWFDGHTSATGPGPTGPPCPDGEKK